MLVNVENKLTGSCERLARRAGLMPVVCCVAGLAVTMTARAEQLQVVDSKLPSTAAIRLDDKKADEGGLASFAQLTSARPIKPEANAALGGGDTCATATRIPSLPFSDTGSTCGFSHDYDAICPFNSPGGADVVYSYTPTANVTVNISLCANSAYDTKLYIYANTCSGSAVACNDDSCSTPSYPSSYVSRLDGVSLSAGTTYYFVIDGYSSNDCGSYTLDIAVFGGGAPGDTCANAKPVTGIPFSDAGTTCGFANDYDAACSYTSTSPDVVYSYTPSTNVVVDISLCANSAYDTKLFLYANACSGSPIACNEDSCTTPSYPSAYVSSLQGVSLTAGTTYYIVIDGYAGACGTYTINIAEGVPAPECPSDSLLSHPVHTPSDAWSAGTSEANVSGANYLRYENFSGLGGLICGVRWWGIAVFNNGSSWVQCTETNPSFEIKFYQDNGGQPGTAVCSYTLTATVTSTGLAYGGFGLNEYNVALPSCCTLAGGWVSIQGLGDVNCWFLWMSSPTGDGASRLSSDGGLTFTSETYDLNVCLTGQTVTGACCNDVTGTCTDGVAMSACQPPLRFSANALCSSLGPPCGQATGPCCYSDNTCQTTQSAACSGGIWLGSYATCDMCPCFVDCPAGSNSESEACGSDTNGGCNMTTPAFEPIDCGDTVCGTAWFNGTTRDTDWYKVELSTLSSLTWTVEAEFPMVMGLLEQTTLGVPGCSNMTGYISPYATGTDCQPTTITTGALPAGTYYLFVAPTLDGPVVGCSISNHYVASLSCTPLAPSIRVEPSSFTFQCTNGVQAGQQAGKAAAQAVREAGALDPDFLPPGKLVDPNEITKALADGNGRADVIVNLAKPMAILAATDFNQAASLAALQKEVSQLQTAVLASLAPQEFTTRYRYQNMAAFSGSITQEGLDRLKSDPRVASIEPVRILEAHLAQGIPLMNALAFRSMYNGAGMAIAICDTGIDYNHPMLGGGGFPNTKVIGGYDFGDSDADPIAVGEAHGTCCAGIAAGNLGTVDDYVGGVANNAKLYAVKIAPNNSGSATTAAMVAAWDWCVTHKNDDPNNPILVISTSFGGDRAYSTCDASVPSMTTAANNARAAGITVLASSGNNGWCESMGWPACISSVASVGAVYDAAFGVYQPCLDPDSCATKYATSGCSSGYYAIDNTAPDRVTSYSNSAGFLTLLAPSNQAYSADIVGSDGYSTGDYFSGFGGTSAACPYAAGAVACLQQAAKAITGSYLTPQAAIAALTTTGEPISDAKVPGIIKPRVNLDDAIASLAPCEGQTLTIHNDGNAALVVSSITVPSWLTLSPPVAAPYTLPPGAEIGFCVTMNCQQCTPGGVLDGSIQIVSNDLTAPNPTVVAVHADCPPLLPGDFDGDGDVDENDVTRFGQCFTGPAIPYNVGSLPVGCTAVPDQNNRIAPDFDKDADVDQADFGVLQRCYSGDGNPGNPNCAD